MKAFEEECQPITLESKSGKFFGMFHIPKSQYPCPAVLFLHGFGSNKIGAFRRYVFLSRLLSQQGIASLRFDFRGAGDSDGVICDMTIEDFLEDATQALYFLQNHPLIDSRKLGILGSSFGGALSILFHAQTKAFQAHALWAPVFSGKLWLQSFLKQKQSSEQKARPFSINPHDNAVYFLDEKLHPHFVSQFAELDVGSALSELGNIPLLHIQGNCDLIVEKSHKDRYELVRKNAKARTVQIQLEKSGHEFNIAEERQILLAETSSWFKNILG